MVVFSLFWRSVRTDNNAQATTDTFLCVNDSFTF